MSKPPNRLYVAPHWYTVTADPHINDVAGVVGATGCDVLDIRYDPDNAPSQLRETLLHEAMHAMAHQVQFQGKVAGLSEDQEEFVINGLAPRILALLKDNPRFLAFMLEAK